jgi:glycosyltransferase involved in cell wall biosynthesis
VSSSPRRVHLRSLSGLRVAVVHDWLPVFAGAERVLAEILGIVPQADVFTLVDFLEGKDRDFLKGHEVKTSFMQRLPWAKSMYRRYLPLAPLAIEQFDLRAYDLVVSSSYVVAKAVLTGPHQLHVSYVHTPVRFAWDQQFDYIDLLRKKGRVTRRVFQATLHYLRLFDTITATRPDRIVVNSNYVRARVRKYWGRDAEVIYPPVNVTVDSDLPAEAPEPGLDPYYVTVSRLVPYKRIDLIVDAFTGMPEKRLVVIGDGPERRALENRAGTNVTFMGYVEDPEVRRVTASARAFVFAAREDFGIAPVEAMAAGVPVIAYGVGGVVETVIDGETGIHFPEQTPASIEEAVATFENRGVRGDLVQLKEHASKFSAERFRLEFSACLSAAWQAHRVVPNDVNP